MPRSIIISWHNGFIGGVFLHSDAATLGQNAATGYAIRHSNGKLIECAGQIVIKTDTYKGEFQALLTGTLKMHSTWTPKCCLLRILIWFFRLCNQLVSDGRLKLWANRLSYNSIQHTGKETKWLTKLLNARQLMNNTASVHCYPMSFFCLHPDISNTPFIINMWNTN
ncbi:hypothetical protein KSP40_PGU018452 [Platanthera guangdongensis]|uniref:Uncharacterized protein n=1 Tax=Platanthera guangdongensis TaxID=2320717 RepID=A0ABR2LD67_9ASPA